MIKKCQKSVIVSIVFSFMMSSVAIADFQEKNLQNLFTSKQQRKKLDNQRKGVVYKPINKVTKKIKVNGYMKRSQGKNVIWINNKSTLKTNIIDNIVVDANSINEADEVKLRVNGKVLKLQPGIKLNNKSDKK